MSPTGDRGGCTFAAEHEMGQEQQSGVSRRAFLAGAAALGAGAVWRPVLRVPPAVGKPVCAPPGFPAGIELSQQMFENWAGEIRVERLWTCTPREAADVVRLADWAVAHGYRLRPGGSMHGWAPFTVMTGSTCDQRTVLVDTKRHLTVARPPRRRRKRRRRR